MYKRVTSRGHHMGWRRDQPRIGDHQYMAPPLLLKDTVAVGKLSLRGSSFMPAIYDQGEIGSCTCNCSGRMVQFDRRKESDKPDWIPSRLLMYYDVRKLEGTIPYDAGAELRDVIKTLVMQGVCDETLWPYDIAAADSQTGLFPAGSHEVTQPPASVYTAARQDLAIQPQRITQNIGQMKACLAEGYLFVFGFTVYSTIYDSRGMPVVDLPMPTANDEAEGGHAITCTGWDDHRMMPNGQAGAFEIANSWGPEVQDGGYFYMPYAYATNHNLASDFWTIRRTT